MQLPNVLMLSWEFPPRIVGGLAPHVYELGTAVAPVGGVPDAVAVLSRWPASTSAWVSA